MLNIYDASFSSFEHILVDIFINGINREYRKWKVTFWHKYFKSHRIVSVWAWLFAIQSCVAAYTVAAVIVTIQIITYIKSKLLLSDMRFCLYIQYVLLFHGIFCLFMRDEWRLGFYFILFFWYSSWKKSKNHTTLVYVSICWMKQKKTCRNIHMEEGYWFGASQRDAVSTSVFTWIHANTIKLHVNMCLAV